MDLLQSADFTAYVKKLIERHHVPGLAIAIVQDDKVSSAAYGKASLEPARDFTTDTLFCVGSAAKSLTAASVALLVEDDKHPEVQFDAPVSKLLPGEFVLPGEDHDDVTVEDVLSHRTGMAPHEYAILGPRAKQPDDARSITMNLRNLSVIAPNREEFTYCNMMYTASTYLVERISGMPFSDFLRQRIFDPLGMNSSYLLLDSVKAKGQGDRVATGYSWEKGQHREIHCCDGPEAQGAGQIFSSIDDYARWVKAMIRHEGPITERISTALTTKRIQTDPEQDEKQESCTFYALGWQVHEYGGHKMVSHDGGEPGYQCNHFFLPELNFGGAIFSNCDQADTLVSLLMYRLIDDVAHADQKSQHSDSVSESGSESESVSDEDEDDDGLEEELRQELSPGIEQPQPQKIPLSAYTGRYWNKGYRGIEVEERDGVLHVDGTDRSYGFTLSFKHICEQTKYICYVTQTFESSDLPIKAEFRLEDNKAVKLGLHLEERIDDYIWFDKVDG